MGQYARYYSFCVMVAVALYTIPHPPTGRIFTDTIIAFAAVALVFHLVDLMLIRGMGGLSRIQRSPFSPFVHSALYMATSATRPKLITGLLDARSGHESQSHWMEPWTHAIPTVVSIGAEDKKICRSPDSLQSKPNLQYQPIQDDAAKRAYSISV